MRARRVLGLRVAVVLLFVAACDGSALRPPDAGPADTGVAGDAPPSDAGTGGDGATDAAAPRDAGHRDAGSPVDAGPPCGGSCPTGETCCPTMGVSWACMTLPDGGACVMPDLTVDSARLTRDVSFGWDYFDPTDCGVVDGCVGGSGWRRLMRFSTQTPNLGDGDMHVGAAAAGNPAFDYNACTRSYLFTSYATYDVLDTGGAEVASGFKRAFCLMDTDRYVVAPTTPTTARYDCSDQGIQRGWSDVYYAGLDCQWVDVTDVAPGDYTLRVSLNPAHRIIESSYDNNVVSVPLTVPPDVSMDPTLACTGSAVGPSRDCGWVVAGTYPCTAGAAIAVSCGTGCHTGACTGDPVMRVCDGTTACTGREAIGSDDDCATGVYCPRVPLTCPASGNVTVLTAPYMVGDTYACAVGVL